ncbi:hypothetical protein FACS1894217_10740 [Clostridia bacterium]|nr:hypothetical protein FACS1894217_10740 [Clostridia bacterium]
MKKIVSVICYLLSVICILTACSAAPATTNKRVVCTFYPVYLAAANLTRGTDVEVSLLTAPTAGCLHDYQLTPAELTALSKADLVLAVGGGMENFLSRVTEAYPKLDLKDCSAGIELIPENAHYWVYAEDYIAMVKNIAKYLNVDENANGYLSEIEALRDELEVIRDLPDKNIVTFHEAFDYWERYGLNIAAAIEREPGTEPTPGELADTINIVKALGIKALFAEPQYPDNAALTIARETGATVYSLDPVASGPLDELDYYQVKMRKNLATLKLALGG